MNAWSTTLAALLATSLVAGLCSMGTPAGEEAARATTADTPAPAMQAAAAPADQAREAVEDAVQGSAADTAAQRRKELIQEAVAALDETHKALKALEDGETAAALDALAIATGKLDLVVARNPRLALAPVDVRLVTHDLYATVEDIRRVREQALEHMKAGRLQDARALVEGLRSDIVVEEVNVPLGTYPAAIKAITPLIDDGRIEEAKRGLLRALNTLVVLQQVHPLPILRARHMLTRAEELATTADRTGEQNEELTGLLDGTRKQLEFAQVLGYGQPTDFQEFYTQLDEIASKTRSGKSGSGFFDKIREALRVFGGRPSDGS